MPDFDGKGPMGRRACRGEGYRNFRGSSRPHRRSMQREFANCRFEFPPETAEALGAYKEKLTQRKSELEKRIVKIDSLMARLDEKITDLASRGQEETLTIE